MKFPSNVRGDLSEPGLPGGGRESLLLPNVRGGLSKPGLPGGRVSLLPNVRGLLESNRDDGAPESLSRPRLYVGPPVRRPLLMADVVDTLRDNDVLAILNLFNWHKR